MMHGVPDSTVVEPVGEPAPGRVGADTVADQAGAQAQAGGGHGGERTVSGDGGGHRVDDGAVSRGYVLTCKTCASAR